MGRLVRRSVDLDDGRRVELFVNRDTNLVVLDILDADEKGGVELYRGTHNVAVQTKMGLAHYRRRITSNVTASNLAQELNGN